MTKKILLALAVLIVAIVGYWAIKNEKFIRTAQVTELSSERRKITEQELTKRHQEDEIENLNL